jgi:predicted  nucleic acid-binding Zn-ribbon protein
MHPDLAKLLKLQEKDLGLKAVEESLVALHEEVAALDLAVATGEDAHTAAQRAVADAVARRTETEVKIEAYRGQQDRRKQRLEITRPGKVAASIMAELELARSVLTQEESEWVRMDETVRGLEEQVVQAAAELEELKKTQDPERAELLAREESLLAERKSTTRSREASAKKLDKPLRIKYDRLYQSRSVAVVVAMSGPACGACFTTIPLHRRTQIKNGSVLGGCEVCGVILYYTDEEG